MHKINDGIFYNLNKKKHLRANVHLETVVLYKIHQIQIFFVCVAVEAKTSISRRKIFLKSLVKTCAENFLVNQIEILLLLSFVLHLKGTKD